VKDDVTLYLPSGSLQPKLENCKNWYDPDGVWSARTEFDSLVVQQGEPGFSKGLCHGRKSFTRLSNLS